MLVDGELSTGIKIVQNFMGVMVFMGFGAVLLKGKYLKVEKNLSLESWEERHQVGTLSFQLCICRVMSGLILCKNNFRISDDRRIRRQSSNSGSMLLNL